MATRKKARKAAAKPTLQTERARLTRNKKLVLAFYQKMIGDKDLSPLGEQVVDIFRVRDGKVVEHWDVIQPLSETSNNPNGHFWGRAAAGALSVASVRCR